MRDLVGNKRVCSSAFLFAFVRARKAMLMGVNQGELIRCIERMH